MKKLNEARSSLWLSLTIRAKSYQRVNCYISTALYQYTQITVAIRISILDNRLIRKAVVWLKLMLNTMSKN